jgi:hypothetical protein
MNSSLSLAATTKSLSISSKCTRRRPQDRPPGFSGGELLAPDQMHRASGS